MAPHLPPPQPRPALTNRRMPVYKGKARKGLQHDCRGSPNCQGHDSAGGRGACTQRRRAPREPGQEAATRAPPIAMGTVGTSKAVAASSCDRAARGAGRVTGREAGSAPAVSPSPNTTEYAGSGNGQARGAFTDPSSQSSTGTADRARGGCSGLAPARRVCPWSLALSPPPEGRVFYVNNRFHQFQNHMSYKAHSRYKCK